MSLLVSASYLLACLAKIGVNITDKQSMLLKWRLSEEAQKYYSVEETNKFYKAVEQGNTEVIDVVRKEKQKIINKLKKSALYVIPFLILLVLTSCNSIPSPKQLSSDTLLDNEKSFSFTDQKLWISDSVKPMQFKGQWFAVNKDFMKEHDQNQNDLIEALTQLEKEKKFTSLIKYITFTSLAINVLLFLLFKKNRGK